MTHTFIPEYEITQRVTAIRLPNNEMPVTGERQGGRIITMVPVSLRIFDTAGEPAGLRRRSQDRRIEATGPRLNDDGELSATWSTVTVTDAPEWVLAVLDGIR